MWLRHKQIIGLMVRTQAGQILGQIKDFEIDADTSQIVRYFVSSSQLVKKILVQDLIIDKSQVVEINEQEMVVDNGLVANQETIKKFVSNLNQ